MDNTEIIVAVISAIVTITGVIITNKSSNREIQHKLETQQAVMDAKFDNLTTVVNKLDSYAERMPVVEEQIKVINHRLDDLERKER